MIHRHRPARVPRLDDPSSERPLRRTLTEWMTDYDAERPHSGLGPPLPTTRFAERGRSVTGAGRATHPNPRRSGVGYTTSTGWNPSRREYLQSTPVRNVSPIA